MTVHAWRLATGLPIFLSILFPWPCPAAEQVSVADELERLSAVHGFTLVGAEHAEDAYGRADREELYPRLRRLLENFDHVILQGSGGSVERVIIMGEKMPLAPSSTATPKSVADQGESDGGEAASAGGDILVKTERRGTQHSVKVSLEGPGGKRVDRSLLVDTGADFVVLPATMVRELGVSPQDLKPREMQTANGKVTARVGSIPALWLGSHAIPGVEVAFIEDSKLGSGGLLGMSVLGRFRMTIDDQAGSLTLAKKTTAPPSAPAASE